MGEAIEKGGSSQGPALEQNQRLPDCDTLQFCAVAPLYLFRTDVGTGRPIGEKDNERLWQKMNSIQENNFTPTSTRQRTVLN